MTESWGVWIGDLLRLKQNAVQIKVNIQKQKKRREKRTKQNILKQ